jgi:hypothetical protein
MPRAGLSIAGLNLAKFEPVSLPYSRVTLLASGGSRGQYDFPASLPFIGSPRPDYTTGACK